VAFCNLRIPVQLSVTNALGSTRQVGGLLKLSYLSDRHLRHVQELPPRVLAHCRFAHKFASTFLRGLRLAAQRARPARDSIASLRRDPPTPRLEALRPPPRGHEGCRDAGQHLGRRSVRRPPPESLRRGPPCRPPCRPPRGRRRPPAGLLGRRGEHLFLLLQPRIPSYLAWMPLLSCSAAPAAGAATWPSPDAHRRPPPPRSDPPGGRRALLPALRGHRLRRGAVVRRKAAPGAGRPRGRRHRHPALPRLGPRPLRHRVRPAERHHLQLVPHLRRGRHRPGGRLPREVPRALHAGAARPAGGGGARRRLHLRLAHRARPQR
jgi:hypothetical protein